MSEIKSNIRELADKIKGELSIDPATGVATVSEDWYVNNLPEGLTAETYVALTNHNTDVLTAAALANGEAAIDAFKKHKELDRVSLSLPMVGKDSIGVVTDRNYNARNVQTGEVSVKHGRTTASLDIYAADNGRGELKKVREHLYATASAALAD